MAKRERVKLIEDKPSTVVLIKRGRKETERTLLEGEGISAMLNLDGSAVIEVYAGDRSIILRISASDVKSQIHMLREWRNLR